MRSAEEVRLTLPYIELSAHLYGPEDGEPVIALHGWLDNAASFARLAPKLERLRIVALDFPGHGHSDHRPPGSGYALWDFAHDVLQVAEQFGWQRFSLLGHSLGAIISVLVAAALPERVRRLALIDGLVPYTGEAINAPAKLGEALTAQLIVDKKRKPVYRSVEQAVEARMKGVGAVTYEAAELLARRGLMPVPGGYTWRTDTRLMLPSPLRLTQAHAEHFARAVRCPIHLILADQGLLYSEAYIRSLIEELNVETSLLPGGHHLHLDTEEGACAVADRFNYFFSLS